MLEKSGLAIGIGAGIDALFAKEQRLRSIGAAIRGIRREIKELAAQTPEGAFAGMNGLSGSSSAVET